MLLAQIMQSFLVQNNAFYLAPKCFARVFSTSMVSICITFGIKNCSNKAFAGFQIGSGIAGVLQSSAEVLPGAKFDLALQEFPLSTRAHAARLLGRSVHQHFYHGLLFFSSFLFCSWFLTKSSLIFFLPIALCSDNANKCILIVFFQMVAKNVF